MARPVRPKGRGAGNGTIAAGTWAETCDELGYDLIPFAIETYGKFGKAALKHLKILQTMALEEGVRCEAGITPWFARSFVDGATQAIGVALQRSIVRDQLRRAHFALGGDACCDEGCSSSDFDADGTRVGGRA